ncbi:hypothetical protein WJX84_011391 [Apatococcus fuscideae]|uniref:BatC protein n=1 Tax=Apatococcus fuscideae TaxID=2026836 RepID=A0AAW1TFD0_9CHLO
MGGLSPLKLAEDAGEGLTAIAGKGDDGENWEEGVGGGGLDGVVAAGDGDGAATGGDGGDGATGDGDGETSGEGEATGEATGGGEAGGGED